MIVEGGKTRRGNRGRLAICVIGCKATAQGLIHKEMVEGGHKDRGGLATGETWSRERRVRSGGYYLPSSLFGISSQVRQTGKSDRGPPSCPPSPVGCPSQPLLLPTCLPNLPTAHCVFRATVSTRAGSLPAATSLAQLTGRQRQKRSPSNIQRRLKYIQCTLCV